MKVGVVGCGNIFDQYLGNAPLFTNIKLAACASRRRESVQAKVKQFGLRAMDVDELLNDPEIGMIINLTIPEAHAEISLRALNAGKHVYSEKPLAISLKDAQKVLETAQEKRLRVGCAPDTILGDSHQACRRLLDEGAIGPVLSGTAFMMSRGPEAWHSNPFFFYQQGGGPMLDIGPYYISALINFLGPVQSVSAQARITFPERTAGCKEHFGKKIPVDVPTHYSGILEFESGALVTCVMSWDIWSHQHTPIELYGTEGSLLIPDPNMFSGTLKLARKNELFNEVPPSPERFPARNRLVGVAEMVDAIANNRAHICSGELAFHVLEVMLAFEESSRSRAAVQIKSRCKRPGCLPDHF